MTYTVRPISDRTWLRPAGARVYHQFDSSWGSTLDLLGKEVDYLRGRDLVIECDVRERDIRLDGQIRADAKPAGDAVVVAFDSKHGPLLYRSDRYQGRWKMPGWQANVRAVALTLQALRAVDRYGATETGQQYAGFKALPAGRAMPPSHMTRTDAIALIERVAIGDDGPTLTRTLQRLGEDPDLLRRALRKAKAMTHPDRRDGDRTMWDQVEQAAIVRGVAS